ncbi:hypothetical protein L207DRAFT_529401 [Hyaloscypha variabilis F]|uniref:Zn(2)-C6 fungal-type domain-containing protein n=1 Tax=Hyaloscypha variabilis (strain UAMH 11265 / GT02V1 / F) TaxID=1149755 RepID=A0A2J6RLR0_HYAVF|nr:hypothetical protein L207DRAFT_529401 [Hyaloscypha variabilis F]
MQEPPQYNAVKARHIKLRASCDACFLAKVKCSKARPVCSRCLACGSECTYSPSCRAGKRKSPLRKAERRLAVEAIHVRPNLASKDVKDPRMRGTYGSRERQDALIASEFTPGTLGGSFELATSYFMTSVPLSHELSVESSGSITNDDFFNPAFDWVTQTETGNTSTYFDNITQSHLDQLSIPSYESSNSSWGIPKGNVPLPSPPPDFVSSPITNPTMDPKKPSSCPCFTTCLETLQRLHYREIGCLDTESTLFENQDAIATCSKVLECPACTSKGLSELQATVLATIISNLISTLQSACKKCSSTFHKRIYHYQQREYDGNFNIIRENISWLVGRNIARSLKDLEELFSKFQQFLERDNETVLSYALACQLRHSLQAGLDGLKECKDFLMQP